jgi:hypothetical protein
VASHKWRSYDAFWCRQEHVASYVATDIARVFCAGREDTQGVIIRAESDAEAGSMINIAIQATYFVRLLLVETSLQFRDYNGYVSDKTKFNLKQYITSGFWAFFAFYDFYSRECHKKVSKCRGPRTQLQKPNPKVCLSIPLKAKQERA